MLTVAMLVLFTLAQHFFCIFNKMCTYFYMQMNRNVFHNEWGKKNPHILCLCCLMLHVTMWDLCSSSHIKSEIFMSQMGLNR